MEITALQAQPSYVTRDGSHIRELMHPNASRAANQSLAHATVLPGHRTQRHFHPRSEELYHVLSGRGAMFLDGASRSVAAGDTVLIPPGAHHGIENTGAAPLLFLCCCAPPYAHDDTVLVEAQT